ncbi:MAG: PVC-type heme-binding CxxCH protein [Limisphaerales bacterium]
MKLRVIMCLTLLLTGLVAEAAKIPGSKVRRSQAIDLKFKSPGFQVPDGYTVELVAGPPLVNHPIMAGFDDRGRLFVSETSGENLRNKELDEQLPSHMTVLEDVNGDGFFDKSTRFVDRMTFPQGALWHQGALYVSSPPGLWRFEDTNNDGVADKREQLADGFAYTGNAADVHGPFLHPNGRLYWCHGRKGHEVYQGDGKTLVSKAKGARIWSCLPDGSDIQVHAGGGMDNPVEVVFTPEGDIIGSVNLFYGRPRGDVLVHWQYGGAFPRHDQQAVITEFKRTGDLLPEIHNFGHVAVSGLCRYRSDDFRGDIFQTFFNMAKIQRVEIDPNGKGGYAAKVHDFLQADSRDVHFTDVFEDEDGSLLVIDTGGWFRIGCPTSQIAKPDIRGGIYRVRKTIGDRKRRVRDYAWAKLEQEQLVALLESSQFAVRDRAREQLIVKADERTPGLVAPLLKSSEDDVRLNAIWTMSRLDNPLARALLWATLDSENARDRQTACNALGAIGDRGAVSRLTRLLHDPSLAVQREAAVALGRIGDSAAGLFLVEKLSQRLSREVEHATIYAVIELNDAATISWALEQSGSPARTAAILTAADQMDASPLKVHSLLAHLGTADEALAAAVTRVATRRSEWAGEIASVFGRWVEQREVLPAQLRSLRAILPAHLNTEAGQSLIARLLDWPNDESGEIFRLGTELIAATAAPKLDSRWKPLLDRKLSRAQSKRLGPTLAAIGKLRDKSFDPALQKLGRNQSLPRILRVKALAAVSSRGGRIDNDSMNLLMELLGHGSTVRDRGEAARLLGSARLTTAQLKTLAPKAVGLGPISLPSFLQAFVRNRDAGVGQKLVTALIDSPGTGSLNLAELKRILSRYPPEVMQAAGGMLAELERQTNTQTRRLASLVEDLPEGNFLAGKRVFESQQALCSVCHRVDGKGGQVGPDLSTIGRIRGKRDLLESILFPSATLSRDFEAYSIDMTDGESQTGVLHSDNSEAVNLAIANGQIQSIPRDRIKAIRPSALSLMPQGLDQVMTRKQLADLITYLERLK